MLGTGAGRGRVIARYPLHDLRHSFASMLVNHGRPIYEVAEILGHNQLSTTKRYSHLQNERLVEAANIAGQVVMLAGE